LYSELLNSYLVGNILEKMVDCTIVGDLLHKRTCRSFKKWEEAQKWFEDRNPGWKRLDGNHDGVAYQSLK